jgi:methyl-accepting chemotaxis protein
MECNGHKSTLKVPDLFFRYIIYCLIEMTGKPRRERELHMFKNMKLKAKLMAMTIGFLVLTGVALGIVTYLLTHKMAQDLVNQTLRMKIQGDIRSSRLYVERHLGKIHLADGQLVDGQSQPIAGRFELVDALHQDLGVAATIFVRDGNDFTRVTTNIVKPDGQRAVGTKLGTKSAAYNDVMKKTLYIGQAVILGKTYLTAYDPVMDESGELIGILFLGIPRDDINALADSSMQKIFFYLILAILVIIGAAALVSYFFSRNISRLLTRIALNLREDAEQMASASRQISAASQSLAEGTSEQAAGIEEASSSLEEMSSMTKQNADNTRHADALMRDARQVIDQAHEAMGKLKGSMQEISSASQETSKIVKTIDEIAFQTNLLALNAAVEAARAGEAGAGFAVVASEVRNLAMRAAEAAKNTSGLLDGIVKKVKDGSDLTSKTNEAFNRVAESTAKVADLMGEISAASDEQALGIEQLNKAVSEMDKVIQQNAAGAEESASASGELSGQAATMKSIVTELVALVDGAKAVETCSVLH